MANAKVEIYVDEVSNEEQQQVTFTKTPMKMGGLGRIPLTPAKRNNAMTPGRGKLSVQGKQPVFVNSAKRTVNPEQTVQKLLLPLPDTEHYNRLASSLPKIISEIDLDQLESPYQISVTDDEIEQEIEFLSWNPIESATRMQKSIGQEIADMSMDSMMHPSFDADYDEFVFFLD